MNAWPWVAALALTTAGPALGCMGTAQPVPVLAADGIPVRLRLYQAGEGGACAVFAIPTSPRGRYSVAVTWPPGAHGLALTSGTAALSAQKGAPGSPTTVHELRAVEPRSVVTLRIAHMPPSGLVCLMAPCPVAPPGAAAGYAQVQARALPASAAQSAAQSASEYTGSASSSAADASPSKP